MSKAPTFGAEVLRIAPADIFIPKRLGLYFPDKAAALGELMAVHGQRTPGTVRKPLTKEEKESGRPWVLIAGRHRLGGAEIKGLDFVALERIGVTIEEALDEEASENLDRREQPPLERAIFIHATCEAARLRIAAQSGGIKQQQAAIAARWAKVKDDPGLREQALQEETDDTCGHLVRSYGWEESVAEAFGRDKRTIRRALALYRMVIEPFPELTQALSNHPVVGNNAAQLQAIAGIDRESDRRKAIELLLENPEMGADMALASLGLARAGTDKSAGALSQKYYDQISGGWNRLNLGQRREFLPKLAALVNTPELKRELRDMLNAELGE